MKIRRDFVTNSSSSSFVVAFKRKPQSIEEMKKMLFDDEIVFYHPYPPNDDSGTLDALRVAATVFNDVKDQSPLNLSEVISEMLQGHIDGGPDSNDFRLDGSWRTDWDKYDAARWQYAEEIAKTFFENNKDKEIFVFTYADEDGSYYCALEHGDLFSRLNHVRISKH